MSVELLPEHTDDAPEIEPAIGEGNALTAPLNTNELIENVPLPEVADHP